MLNKHQLPTLYIVTPSFNQANFLAKNLQSVFDQVSSEFVIVHHVQDGKSTDKSTEILQKWQKDHSSSTNYHFSWSSVPDTGQTNALNLSINKLVKYELKHPAEMAVFSYLNSDDVSQPGAFKKIISTFLQHPETEWLVGDAKIIDEADREIHQPIRRLKSCLRFFMRLGFFKGILSWSNPLPQPSVFIRLPTLIRVGDFNETLDFVMDYEYWWRLSTNSGQPVFVSQVLSQFRVHSLSKGGTAYVQQFNEELSVAESYTSNKFLNWWHTQTVAFILFVYKYLKG